VGSAAIPSPAPIGVGEAHFADQDIIQLNQL
jgi:hypothetical protein